MHPPAAQWLMAVGTSAVAAALIGELSRQVRARTRDLSAVAELATAHVGAETVTSERVAAAVCVALCRAADADAVVLYESLPDDGRLHVLGITGSAGQARAFEAPAATRAFDDALRSRRPCSIGGAGRGRVRGHVQPIIYQGRVGGLLALSWERSRRDVPPRVAEAAELFANETSVALERVERETRAHERLALELNDEIVQGLAVAKYALSLGRTQEGEQAVSETLARARALVTSQLDALHGDAIKPGSLRRHRAG
jgi:hypothetical protein